MRCSRTKWVWEQTHPSLLYPVLPRPNLESTPATSPLLRSSGAPLRVYTAQAEGFTRKPGAMVAVELQMLDLWDHLKAA